jgi:hypothetical protein
MPIIEGKQVPLEKESQSEATGVFTMNWQEMVLSGG